jgi:hypothetical protein
MKATFLFSSLFLTSTQRITKFSFEIHIKLIKIDVIHFAQLLNRSLFAGTSICAYGQIYRCETVYGETV